MPDPFAIARRVVGPAADLVPMMRTWKDVFDRLAELETTVWASRARLEALLETNGLTAQDMNRFNELRAQLLDVQLGAYDFLRILLPIDLFRQIPRPTGVPAITIAGLLPAGPGARYGTRVRGLGAAPIVVWAAIVLAIAAIALAAAAIVISVARVADYIAEVIIAQTNAKMYNDLVDTRLAAFRECIAAGGEIEQCREVAFGIAPPPNEVLPRRQKNTALTILLTVGGIAAAATGIAFGWKYMQRKTA